MQIGICLVKYKQKNAYVAYDIQLQDGRVVKMPTAELKSQLDAKNLVINNLIYSKNGRLLDYTANGKYPWPKTQEIKEEEKPVPPVEFNESTHNYRFKVRIAFEKERGRGYNEFELYDIETRKLIR